VLQSLERSKTTLAATDGVVTQMTWVTNNGDDDWMATSAQSSETRECADTSTTGGPPG